MVDHADLNELAGRVSDGDRIDWESAEESAVSEEDRRVIRNLRLLADVSRVHRTAAGEIVDSGATQTRSVSAAAAGAGASASEIGLGAWGNLQIRQKVGEGGFGDVYLAWDTNLDREVALKLLKGKASARKSLAASVIREGRLLARVHHPNVITVHGAETNDGRVGLWMEFVRGRSLEELLREQGKFGAREAALIGLDLCRALSAVHRAGLVHRDVKTRNVMRQDGGRIVLMDFGAGRDMRDVRERQDEGVSGTPLYIAPELFVGERATARSDIYALGVLLYHLVTDRYPVRASSWAELREKHSRQETRLLRDVRSDLPEGFVSVVERALAWDPTRRFATAGEMDQALSLALGVERAPALHETSPGARRRGALTALTGVAIVAALLAIAMTAGWISFDRSAPPPETTRRTVGRPATAGLDDATTGGPVLEETTAGADSDLFVAPVERPGSPTAGRPAVAALEPYTVQASVIRLNRAGKRERLEQGARLALGDWLSLEFEASRDLHVYVINEDEKGRAFALFPLPGLDLANPLPGAQRHELPGRRGGKAISWEIDTAGGREHLMVLASPERLIEFEAEMARLALPLSGTNSMLIPEEMKEHLRSIGGLAERPETSDANSSVDRLFEMAQRLAVDSEVVRGAWLRQIELENPAP